QAVKQYRAQLLLNSSNDPGATNGVSASVLMSAVPAAIASQNVAQEAYAAANTLGARFKAGWQASMDSLPTTIMKALEGGGNVIASVGAMVGKNLIGGLADKFGSMFKGTLGSVLGSVIPGLGTMLGSMIGPLLGGLAGKIWGGIKNLFGGGEEGTMV